MMKPASIEASRSKGELVIVWDDGHRSTYPLRGLRAACPCAECRGGHENMSAEPSPSDLERPLAPGQSAELDSVEAVGNYALQPRWKDGHAYGIYTWGYLRRLCPCGVDHATVG
jgi:DUF971 family protein